MTTSHAPFATTHVENKLWGSFLTSVALAVILSIGPLILGGLRIWLMLPILSAVWLLVLFQAIRLFWNAPKLNGRFFDAIDVFVVLFLGYSTLQYFITPVPYSARIEMLNVYSFAAVFWTCRYGFSRKKHALFLLASLAVIGLIVAGSGFLFYLKPGLRPYAPELLQHYYPRLCGTYGCPNHFGALVVMTLGIGLAACVLYRISWTLRIVGFYLVAMMVVAVGFSLSRGSWLGLMASILALSIFLVRHRYMRWYWPTIGFALIAAAFAGLLYISPSARERFSEIGNHIQNKNLDTYVRIILTRDAFRIWEDHPVTGTGPGTFIYEHMRYQDSTYSSLAEYTHNDYMNLLADYGLVGALIVLGFIITVTRKLFRHLGPLPDADDSLLLACGLCAWCALLVHSTVDFNLHLPGNAYVLFALVGMGLRRSAAKSDSAPGLLPRAATARPLAVVIFLAAGGLLAITLYTARGYFPYILAERNFGTTPCRESFAGAVQAIEADPYSPLSLKYIGDLYRNQAAAQRNLLLRATYAQQAAGYYERAVSLNPINDELLALKGLSLDFMSHYQESLPLYQSVIQRQPYNGYFRLLLGLHYWRRNMLVEAREVFKIGARCPHGNYDNAKALDELNRILGVQEKAAEHEPTLP